MCRPANPPEAPEKVHDDGVEDVQDGAGEVEAELVPQADIGGSTDEYVDDDVFSISVVPDSDDDLEEVEQPLEEIHLGSLV